MRSTTVFLNLATCLLTLLMCAVQINLGFLHCIVLHESGPACKSGERPDILTSRTC